MCAPGAPLPIFFRQDQRNGVTSPRCAHEQPAGLRLRDHRPGPGPRPARPVRVPAPGHGPERHRPPDHAVLPAHARSPARSPRLPADRDHAPALPGTRTAGTAIRRRGPSRTRRAGHDCLRLQLDRLRRRDHALHAVAEPDRPVRPRMEGRLRALGPARPGARHLGAAPGNTRLAAQRTGRGLVRAGADQRGERPAPRRSARCHVRRAGYGRTGAAHPRAPAAAVCALLFDAGQESGAAGNGCGVEKPLPSHRRRRY